MRVEKPETIYLINQRWLSKLKVFLLWNKLQRADQATDNESLATIITPEHLYENYPGQINN